MAQHSGARRAIVQVDLPGLRRIDRQRGTFPVAWFRFIEASIEPVDSDRLPAVGLRRTRSGKLPGMLFTILARRHAVLALKQIAHHTGTGEPLFAGDLLRMYMRYAEKRGWTVTLQSENTTELGGVKDVQLAIRAKGTPAPEDGVWASLKYEGGVHRVQRIPVTESQGRIQTSAAGVIVFPEADEDDDEIEIDQKDLKIDIFMSSGPGGQSVNTTYSAVRMTHIPTGIVVSMQDEKSQIQNRAAALRVLKSRLLAMKHEEEAAQAADMRHSQVRSLDRSERIRTYNFPENRIVDHRTNYKAYNLDAVLDGDLQAVIDSDIQADEADRLAHQK